MPLEEEHKEKPLAKKGADHGRLRRESRPETAIGAAIGRAAEEAESRVLRQRGFPPPSEEERELIAAAPHDPVQIFTTALVVDLQTGERERFTVVSHDEADLEANRISIGSPIGRALLQEYPGAVVTVKTPAGPRLYRILQVQS